MQIPLMWLLLLITISSPIEDAQQQGNGQPSTSEREQSHDPQTRVPEHVTSSQLKHEGVLLCPSQYIMGTPSGLLKASSPPFLDPTFRSDEPLAPDQDPDATNTGPKTDTKRILSPQIPSDDSTDDDALAKAKELMPAVV